LMRVKKINDELYEKCKWKKSYIKI
jgi:hypothetical protein